MKQAIKTTMSREDIDPTRWAHAVMLWDPNLGKRRKGRPKIG